MTTQRKASNDYREGAAIIQHTCGLPEPTEDSLKQGVDKGFDAFFARRGRRAPYVSSYEVGALSVEALEMVAAY
jgi:hypothetical protein